MISFFLFFYFHFFPSFFLFSFITTCEILDNDIIKIANISKNDFFVLLLLLCYNNRYNIKCVSVKIFFIVIVPPITFPDKESRERLKALIEVLIKVLMC